MPTLTQNSREKAWKSAFIFLKKKDKNIDKNRISAEKIQVYENCFEKELETDSHCNKKQ